MSRRVALLRGVNLGGRTLLMRDLADICAQLGYEDVRTLLASGNVVFNATEPSAEIESALEAALEQFGLKTDVLVRDGSELEEVLSRNPLKAAADDHPSHLLVTFHREPFPLEALDRLHAFHSGPEQLAAIGRELFIDYRDRDQMRASTLLASMRKARFPTVATARNWNTVTKIADLTGTRKLAAS